MSYLQCRWLFPIKQITFSLLLFRVSGCLILIYSTSLIQFPKRFCPELCNIGSNQWLHSKTAACSRMWSPTHNCSAANAFFLLQSQRYISQQQDKEILLVLSKYKGATREGAKWAEAHPLAKLRLRNKIKYRIVLIFFVSRWFEVAWFGQFMVLKIAYDTEKLQNHLKYRTSSKWRHK